MSRHTATMEVGGWALLIAAIAALLYFIFGKKISSSVSATLNPASNVQPMTPELADRIANGNVPAFRWQPGQLCAGALYDSGNGVIWCVGANAPSMGPSQFLVGDANPTKKIPDYNPNAPPPVLAASGTDAIPSSQLISLGTFTYDTQSLVS